MSNPTPADVATELRAEMARQRTSIKAVADSTDIPVRRLYDRFNGPESFNLDEVFLVCSALGLSVDELFGRAMKDAA